MSRALAEPVSRSWASGVGATAGRASRDIARAGADAVIAGSIAALGTHYVIGVEAMACDTGESLTRQEAEVADKEGLPTAVDRAAASLREQLGDARGRARAAGPGRAGPPG